MQFLLRSAFLVPTLLLAGCAISTSFRGPGYEAGRGVTLANADTVYVSITHAVLRDDGRHSAMFWTHVDRVVDSLEDQPGFIGFTRRKQLFGNQAWTMSVWQDEAQLTNFINGEVHQRAIREAMVALEHVRFARVQLSRDDIPLAWSKALALIEQQNRGYER